MTRPLIDVQFHKCKGTDPKNVSAFLEVTNLTDEPFLRISVDWNYRVAVLKPSRKKGAPARKGEQVATTKLPSSDDGPLSPSASRQFNFSPSELKQLLSVFASVSSDQISVVIQVESPEGNEWQVVIPGRDLGLWVDRAMEIQ